MILRRIWDTTRLKKHIQPKKKPVGNPNWGKPSNFLIPVPYEPTGFEILVAELGLKADSYVGSPELKKWVNRNFKTKYVPENLLESWGFVIDIGEL